MMPAGCFRFGGENLRVPETSKATGVPFFGGRFAFARMYKAAHTVGQPFFDVPAIKTADSIRGA